MSRVLGLAAMSFLLAGLFLAAVPVGAQGVDERIKAVEQELSQLKAEQIELKKEEAAEMPTLSYSPGNGLRIEAADKAWSVRFGLEAHFIMEFQSGRDEVGRTQGEVNGRRFRPRLNFCIDNCLWDLEAYLDLDGWGTGNAQPSPRGQRQKGLRIPSTTKERLRAEF